MQRNRERDVHVYMQRNRLRMTEDGRKKERQRQIKREDIEWQGEEKERRQYKIFARTYSF